VLSAPAGYGTTTLAHQLAEQRGGAVAQCRLADVDAADGGAGRLLAALVQAVPQLADEPPVVDLSTAPLELLGGFLPAAP
jgi:ATP/maltotriose-dependent transcriptional regulator MalT